MQRWARSYGHAYQGMTGDSSGMIKDSEGKWVRFSDAEDAIEAARYGKITVLLLYCSADPKADTCNKVQI